MAKPNARVAFVQINSEMEDSVIIDKPESEKATETAGVPAKEKTQEPETSVKEKGEEEEEEDEDVESVDNSDNDGEPRYPRRGRICYNNRDYSPRRPRSLVDTKSLNKLLKLNDVCAETVNDLMIYIVNHPFHAGDLENISWVFKMGVSDTWVKKPMTQKDRERVDSEERGRGRYYDDRYDRYDDYEGPGPREMIRRTTIARLGNALKVFKSDEKKYGTENVKFVIVVKGRGNGGCMKLRVAHSRQAAMAEIFHEMLNRYEIVFVGAILQEVIVPVDRKDKAATFQRVASLKEAQELAGPVVGVIC